jgi:hypothetical protein
MTTASVAPAPLHTTSDMLHTTANNNNGERRKGGSNGKRRKNAGRGTQRGNNNNNISSPPKDAKHSINDDEEEEEEEDETDTSPPGTAPTLISPPSIGTDLPSKTDSEHNFSHARQEEEKKQAHGEDEEYFIQTTKPTGNGNNRNNTVDADDPGGTDNLLRTTDRSLAFSPAFSELGPEAEGAVDGDEGDDEEDDDEEDDDNDDDDEHDEESGYRDRVLPLKTGDKQEYILYGGEDGEEEDDDDDGYSNGDPFVYSDDSESLSDAYFHPQPERRLPNSNFFYPQQQQQQQQPLDPYRSLNIVTPPEEVHSTASAAAATAAPNSRAYANLSAPPHDPALSEHNRYTNHPKAPLSSYGSMASHHSSSAAPERGIIPWSKSNTVSPINTTFAGGTILEDYPVEEGDVVVWHTTNPRNSDHSFYNDQQYWQNQQQQQRGKLPPHHHHQKQQQQHHYQQSEQPQQSRRSKKYHRKRPKRNRRRRPLQDHHRERRDSGDFEPHRQQQQYARELAVTRVRGKQQNVQSCNDSWCAILFVIQFLFVMACAIRYGCTLMRPTLLVNPSSFTMAMTTVPTNNDRSGTTNTGDYFNPIGPSALYQAGDVYSPPAVSSPRTTTTVATGTGSTTSKTPSTTMDKDGSTTTTTLGKIGNGGKTTTTRTSSSSLDDDMITDMGYDVTKKKGDSPISTTAATTAKTTSSTTPTTIVEVTTVNGVAEFSIDYQNVIKLLCASGMYACVISYLTFGFMLIVARSLIQIILVFSVILALAWGICGTVFSDPDGFIALMGFSALILSLWYAVYSSHRIPFASTNLYAAMCAMRCTADIILLAAATLLISFLWCLVWTIALMGVVNTGNSNDCIQTDECQTHIKTNHWNVPTYILFLFSFYWTNMVIKNITRVTVASTIGTWWFRPREIHPCCSHAVGRPLVRALTTSFGSICLGSLVVLPAQLIAVLSGCCCWCSRDVPDEQHQPFSTLSPKSSGKGGLTKTPEAKQATTPATEASALTISSNPSEYNFENEGDTVAYTGKRCHSRVMARTRRFIRSSNQWSYTYVGMYGYRFVEGGEKALELFETREWMDVVRDNLIQNILLIASVVIGGSAGTFAVLVEELDGYMFTTLNRPIVTSCLLGSVLGYVLSSVLLMGVVGSAVNTVLVCFAAGPFEFDKNHPRLSREMREVWSQQVWEPSDSVV